MNITNQSRFILARAAHLLVEAYKLQIAEYQTVMPLALSISHDAPDNYSRLKADAMEGKLVVSTLHNTSSIYGASGNLTFRIFHDYGHLLYDAQFETGQEILLAKTQWLDVKRYIPNEWLDVCKTVYMADTVLQSMFEAKTGNFPKDQRAFVLEALVDYMESAE